VPNSEPRLLQNTRRAVGNYISFALESFQRASGGFLSGEFDSAGMETLQALASQREKLQEALPQPLQDATEFLGTAGEMLSDVPYGAQTGAISRSAVMRYRQRLGERGRISQPLDKQVTDFAFPDGSAGRKADLSYDTPGGRVYVNTHLDETGALGVNWVGRTPYYTGGAVEKPLDVGFRPMREILSDLVEIYPEANRTEFQRVSGIRKKSAGWDRLYDLFNQPIKP